MMKVLGIDPGIALTGWGVVEKRKAPKLLKYGCLRTKAGLNSEKRLQKIYDQLQQVINKYQPQVMAIEKIFFNTNAKTALRVGEARGVVKYCAAANSILIEEFTPIQIKSAVAGYGRADKKQVQIMVKSQLGLRKIPQPDDAADAVAVSLTYCFYQRNLEK